MFFSFIKLFFFDAGNRILHLVQQFQNRQILEYLRGLAH